MSEHPTAKQIQVIIEDLLTALGVSYSEVLADTTDPTRPEFRIAADDGKTLIGPKGEHLQALSTLAHQIVRKQLGTEAANFSIDVNRYREQAREGLIQKAKMYADRARSFKSSISVEPMSSYERFIIHEVLGEASDIETCSEGSGSYRHIVIKYIGD
ncbi:MAG: R3H domain-containing nucleic acid-binding protein [Candidatus Paceibacterota bacterium]